MPSDVLRALVGLHDELVRRLGQSAATPEEARFPGVDDIEVAQLQRAQPERRRLASTRPTSIAGFSTRR